MKQKGNCVQLIYCNFIVSIPIKNNVTVQFFLLLFRMIAVGILWIFAISYATANDREGKTMY